jgi:hypothetical protein
MPQPTKNAPDYIDLTNLLGVLGEEYKVVVYFTTRIRADKVEIIGKTYSAPYTIEAPVEHVALVSFPVLRPKDMASTLYTIAFDLWCQHDGAGATAARRGAPTTWRGYPEVPRRRKVG